MDGAGGEGEAAGGLKGFKAKFQKILSNKKLLMIYGGGLLVLILAIGAGVYFLMGAEEVEVVPTEEQAVEEEVIEEEEAIVEKVNIYKMEPFFLPIRDNGKETGRYIYFPKPFIE